MDIKYIRQPNGYTCGSTALYIACEAKGIKTPALLDLADQMGTNPRTGTTDIEMSRGLEIVGLPVLRYALMDGQQAHEDSYSLFRNGNKQEAFKALSESVAGDGLFLLRTLMYGIPHWVLAYEMKDNHIFYMCSCSGIGRLNADDLYKIWEPRSFDGFRIL